MHGSKSLTSRVLKKNPRRLLTLLFPLFMLLRIGGRAATTEGTTNDNANYYTAGVVEFRPTIAGMSSSQLLAEHLQAYVDIIESPEALETDIIVFPEGTLNNAFQLTYVPGEKEAIIPCNEVGGLYEQFLIELSCSARRTGKYLVINLSEKEDCSAALQQDSRPCAVNGLNVYNTNVVFDREGRVISRYRKVHVYVENKNTTLQPEYGVFDTDFGVRFGHFICFDILFYTPAQEMVQYHGLTDFIFTSLFYSELPFLTATQLQLGWAWGNNVNLLAAGASYPQSGTTGTGIYAGTHGALVSVMVKGEGERRLYKAQVPKVGFQPLPHETKRQIRQIPREQLNNIPLMKDPQIQNYNSELLEVKSSLNYFKELCYDNLCCTFDIVAEVPDNTSISTLYKYRLGVFDGRRSYEKEEWSDIKVCALYACLSEDSASCGDISEILTTVRFKYIHIRGSLPKAERVLIMPSTVDTELNPLPKDVILWNSLERSSSYEVDIALSEEYDHLLTFGIYAMYYEKSAAPTVETVQTVGVMMVGYVVLRVLFKFK